MAVPVLPGEGFNFRTTAKGNPEYKVRPLMLSRLMQRVNVSQDLRQGHVSRLLSTPRTKLRAWRPVAAVAQLNSRSAAIIHVAALLGND